MDNKNSLLEIQHRPIKVAETVVNIHYLDMEGCVIIWVNGESISTENMVMAIATKFSDTPTSSFIQGDYSNQHSVSLASNLCRKLGKQCYLSWNLPNLDSHTTCQIQKELFRLYSDPSNFQE